jgi:hypothetical protein
LPRNSKTKLDVYTDLPLSANHESLVAISDSSGVYLEKRKKKAEEPIYLNRI